MLSASKLDHIPQLTTEKFISNLLEYKTLDEQLAYINEVSLELPEMYPAYNAGFIHQRSISETLKQIPIKCRFAFLKAFGAELNDHIQCTEDLNYLASLLSEDDQEKFIKCIDVGHLKTLVEEDLFYRVDKNILPFIIKQLDHAFLASTITNHRYLKIALPLIDIHVRVYFLDNLLGMDKLRGFIRNEKSLSWLQSLLPPESWQNIKSHLVLYQLKFSGQREINAQEGKPAFDDGLCVKTNGLEILIKNEANELVKKIAVLLNKDERERTSFALRLSKDDFVVLVYDHFNVIHNYKNWQLQLGNIKDGTCKYLFKIPIDQHFYPDHLALLSDNKTLVGWSGYDTHGLNEKYRKICLINLETLQVQTIEMPFQRKDKVKGIKLSTSGQLIFQLKDKDLCFDIVDMSLQNKKVFPFFNQKTQKEAEVKPELYDENNSLLEPIQIR